MSIPSPHRRSLACRRHHHHRQHHHHHPPTTTQAHAHARCSALHGSAAVWGADGPSFLANHVLQRTVPPRQHTVPPRHNRKCTAIPNPHMFSSRLDATAGCVDGDVRTVNTTGTPSSALGTPATPEVYYKGEWYPVCGHGFWDNGNGTTTLCKKLGFKAGGLVGGYYPNRQPAGVYPKDAMPVGGCRPGEPLTACTGIHNDWGNLDGRDGTCRQGNKVRVSITCSGIDSQPPANPATQPPTTTPAIKTRASTAVQPTTPTAKLIRKTSTASRASATSGPDVPTAPASVSSTRQGLSGPTTAKTSGRSTAVDKGSERTTVPVVDSTTTTPPGGVSGSNGDGEGGGDDGLGTIIGVVLAVLVSPYPASLYGGKGAFLFSFLRVMPA